MLYRGWERHLSGKSWKWTQYWVRTILMNERLFFKQRTRKQLVVNWGKIYRWVSSSQTITPVVETYVPHVLFMIIRQNREGLTRDLPITIPLPRNWEISLTHPDKLTQQDIPCFHGSQNSYYTPVMWPHAQRFVAIRHQRAGLPFHFIAHSTEQLNGSPDDVAAGFRW
jgi:hypothetical protein